MARRGSAIMRPVRQARNLGYKAVRTTGNVLPWVEFGLALFSGNGEEASYRFRAVIRRYVNRYVGTLVGKHLYGSTGGFPGLLRKLLGL